MEMRECWARLKGNKEARVFMFERMGVAVKSRRLEC